MIPLRSSLYRLSLCVLLVGACSRPGTPKPAEKSDDAPPSGPAAANAQGPGGDPPAAAQSQPSPGEPAAADPHAKLARPGAAAGTPAGPPQDVTFDGKLRPETLQTLTWQVPEQWTSQPTTSSMRAAQYLAPGPGGDAEVVVFAFAGGGSVEQNIARWKTQFKAPEGKSIDEATTTTKLELSPLTVTVVDIRGHYSTTMPGSGQPVDIPDARMITAVVEGAKDPYFIRLLGPAKTVDVWAEGFDQAIKTLKPEAAGGQ